LGPEYRIIVGYQISYFSELVCEHTVNKRVEINRVQFKFKILICQHHLP
jgi:hypothetical protein